MKNVSVKPNRSGSALLLSFALALALSALLVYANRSLIFMSRQGVYFTEMNRTLLLANTGLQEAIYKLLVQPDIYLDPAFSVPISTGTPPVSFRHTAALADNAILEGGYYIVTEVSRTVKGKSYRTQIEAYALLSNVNGYLIAADNTTLMAGSTFQNAKVYGKHVSFVDPTATASPATIDGVDYARSISPPPAWVTITTPATNAPVQLQHMFQPKDLILPSVNTREMGRYQSLAGIGGGSPHVACHFMDGSWTIGAVNHIAPPGYNTSVNPTIDIYPGHTSNNGDHVYYCPGDVHIGNAVIHGQVLIAAEANIFIHGNIETDTVPAHLPGTGEGASTVHQLVLISKQNVIISTSVPLNVPLGSPLILQAQIVAPNGVVQATELTPANGYTLGNGPAYMAAARLNFRGAIIANNFSGLGNVFRNGCSFQYDATLASDPPPYGAYYSVVKYWHEKILSSSGPFGS